MSASVLPFKQDDIYLGLAQINGLLRIVDDILEIEYKVKDTTLGFLDSSVKTCRIPLQIIDRIEVEKKWFSTKFEMTFARIPALDNPFQLEGNCLTLSVKKTDLERAQKFRSKLMYEILERKLEDMDEFEDEERARLREQEEALRKESKSRSAKETHQKRGTDEGSGGLKNMLRSD